ncbi:hypothetical protein RJ639_005960 [Escallonia herrerae]|uniref:Uncharacterized protein n=1 Tax=Escallonia herrerae TaxID=1293975 RepID=A0AA89AVA8_9ASTE|nr:hypothetical protein RJ639_005960 [Escallonia herrerae]
MFGSSSSHHQRSWDFEEEIEEALKAYDGSDPKKPLLMATKVQICNLSQSRHGMYNNAHVSGANRHDSFILNLSENKPIING